MSDEVNPRVADSWTRTCSDTVKFSHKWTIDNFSFHIQREHLKRHTIQSSTFSSVANNKIKWYLTLHPSGTTKNSDYVGIFLNLTGSTRQVMANVEFYCIDVENMKKYSNKLSHAFVHDEDWGFANYIRKKDLHRKADVLLPDDKLTIFCEIVIVNDVVNISGERELIQDEMLKIRLNNDFELLFKSHEFSDVTITVSGKDIHAHKLILAARSPVFSAMFKHDMEELKTSRVKIDDVDHEIFMEMLEFIYTDKAPNLEKMAASLLAAAEKYNLERLKALCVEALYKSLTIKNAVDILVLSYLHNADWLKTVVTNFICKFTKDVMNTEAFELMPHAYPDLTVEILRAIRTRKNSLEPFTVNVECSKSSE